MTVGPVLVLGAASWNRMIHVAALPQGRNATIADGHEVEAVGSTGVGKAMALAALGHDVTLHCALGRDAYAPKIIEACTRRGIRMLTDIYHGPTPRHLNIMDKQGGRYSIFLANGPDAPPLDQPRLARAIAAAGTIFLSLAASSKQALALLDETDAEILLDLHDYDGINPWHDPFIAHADIIQLSDVALPEPHPVIDHLLAGRAHQIVLTRAEKGAEIFTVTDHVMVPPIPTDVRDSNGAGDAFSVALWHAQQAGMPLAEAGRFATSAAAFALESNSLFPSDISLDDITARAGPLSD